ncbi:phage portal protein [Accumulibacter sp.]|nr:phage portal protein [Accumulibacter sp.]MBN8499366.1 phage portal protein [Accumulibacter sp.]MBO3713555.1 phage portal protein [Accumulibacter sp.]
MKDGKRKLWKRNGTRRSIPGSRQSVNSTPALRTGDALMGFLSFLNRLRASSSDRSEWGDFWFELVSVRTSSGMRVSADNALRLAAVYASVRILAETMASLPFVFYRQRADGGKDRVTDHWLYRLFAKRPNRYQNPYEWREMLQGHLALRGNAYNRIVANGRREIVKLVPIHPDRIRMELTPSGDYRYRVTDRDAQFLELRKFRITDIARLFRVPPHIIADLDRATFSNIEQQSLEFEMHTMTSWAERWEASLEAELLFDGDDLAVEFGLANLMRSDAAGRSSYYQSRIQDGRLAGRWSHQSLPTARCAKRAGRRPPRSPAVGSPSCPCMASSLSVATWSTTCRGRAASARSSLRLCWASRWRMTRSSDPDRHR